MPVNKIDQPTYKQKLLTRIVNTIQLIAAVLYPLGCLPSIILSFYMFARSSTPILLLFVSHFIILHHHHFSLHSFFLVLSLIQKRSWDSSVGIETGYGLDGLGVGVRVPVASTPALGPNQPIQWVKAAISPRVKVPTPGNRSPGKCNRIAIRHFASWPSLRGLSDTSMGEQWRAKMGHLTWISPFIFQLRRLKPMVAMQARNHISSCWQDNYREGSSSSHLYSVGRQFEPRQR
jgi:hypothetical protein